jgi:hypothetical protein
MDDTIYIFGAGPTGLSLAWLLRNEPNKKIVVIEKYKSAGGTWTTRWTDDNLFTQHSPQVLSNSYVNTIQLWEDMGINYKDFTRATKSDWKTLILNHSSFTDKLKFMFGYLKYIFNEKYYNQITVNQYFHNILSVDGMNVINRLCYILDGVPPSIMTMGELYGSFDQNNNSSILEMTKSSDNGFVKLWVDKLKEQGVEFMFNASLEKLNYVNDKTIAYVSQENDQLYEMKGTVLLALDPLSLLKVLNKSDDTIKSNWGKWDKISNHISKGIYTSLPVQFHFVEGIDVDNISGFMTDWNIACVIIPLMTTSLQTISCSIMDMNAYSSVLKKQVYECNPDEVKQEAWRQILTNNPNLPKNPIITIGVDVNWNESYGWSYDISCATRTVLGPLRSRGQIEDLAIIGPLNYRTFKPTTMEAAVESALRFTGNNVKNHKTLSSILRVVIILIMIIIVLIIIKII